MITYSQLQSQPELFTALTGISVSEFERLLLTVEPAWREREQQRRQRPHRQRAEGGGRSYALDRQQQLLMTLMWLHLSLSTVTLGGLFGVDKSTASRNTRRMRATCSIWRGKWLAGAAPAGQGKTIDRIFEEYPALQALVMAAAPLPEASSSTPASLLARIPPFRGLAATELEAVSLAATVRRIQRQAFFFRQGDPASVFYNLLEGQVRLTEVTPEGHQLLIRFVSPGEAIGIIAALQNSTYPLTAQAVEDCRVLAWDGPTLERLMERIPRIAINGLRLVSQRWHELEERYRELATERVERRIAQTLLRLLRQVGRRVEGGILIDLPLSRQDLAEMTSTTLYTVSRTLSRWEQKQLIETRRQRLLVRYPHGLAMIAEDLPETPPG
jgi:CRP-like cAMP-binding protein